MQLSTMNDFNSNIPHALASKRRNAKECIACGKKEKVMHVELGSCPDPACVKLLRKVKRWAGEVSRHVPILH